MAANSRSVSCGHDTLSTCLQTELAALRRKVAELQAASKEHEMLLAMRNSEHSEQVLQLARAKALLVGLFNIPFTTIIHNPLNASFTVKV